MSCHSVSLPLIFTSKVNIKRKRESATPREENTFDEAFHQLLQEIEKMGNEADNYTKQKLKARLSTHFKQELVFHQLPQQSKPEVVYSSSISLMDAINAASSCAPSGSESSMSTAKTDLSTCIDVYWMLLRL
ncbi:hypothetical protein P5673_011921 [Acropora cervicornis]|uniref:Uncharacterized protein n=1 Tax=Acropora cervicornis TaxID=6130 RepID=A0AAD9QNB0_ACRCE|nr:hypothetical protein P5673_011921 [Acropora cervicornis]